MGPAEQQEAELAAFTLRQECNQVFIQVSSMSLVPVRQGSFMLQHLTNPTQAGIPA